MRPLGRHLSAMRWALTLAALLAVGCHRAPPPVHVTSIRIGEGSLADLREAGIETGSLETAARDALLHAGFLLGDGARPHRARVDVTRIRLAPSQGGGPAQVEVLLEIELTPAEGAGAAGAVRASGTSSATLAAGAAASAWSAAVAGAAREAADGLALTFAEEAKPSEQVIADLASEDARIRERAVGVLGERREAAAVPVLLGKLRDPNREVANRAVGALAQIRDARAVGPLIDVSRNGDAAFTARVARIVGDIGGREAEGYLLTLEAGHPDPRVRRAAHETLGEMRARAGEAARMAAGK